MQNNLHHDKLVKNQDFPTTTMLSIIFVDNNN